MDEKCSFCWKPLKRGEHHICRRCASLMPSVVKVAEEKAKKNPHGGLWKLARGRRNS